MTIRLHCGQRFDVQGAPQSHIPHLGRALKRGLRRSPLPLQGQQRQQLQRQLSQQWVPRERPR